MKINNQKYTVQVEDKVLQSFYDALNEYYGKNIQWLEFPEKQPQEKILSQAQTKVLERGKQVNSKSRG